MLVNLFSAGDATNVNTWSNVPYFVTKAISNAGIGINHINIAPNKLLTRVYKYSIGLILNLFCRVFCRNFRFNFFRSGINNFLIDRQIKRYVKNNPQVDCNIFLTYSFSSLDYSDIPVIHLCDQVYEEVLINRNISPGFFDKKIIERELSLLGKANYIYSTNLSTINLLKGKYNFGNCSELNYRGNLDIEKILIDKDSVFKLKKSSKYILFIGKAYYERGVDILLKAFDIFNSKVNNQYELHIIGPVVKEVEKEPHPNVILHNYLDKSIENEYDTYLELLKKSGMFVFPMRVGPLPAALFEANYFYCPGIITDIHNIKNDIKNFENGILIDDPDPVKFADAMYELSQNEELWERLAINAHNHANKYTLKAMAQTIIDQIHKFEKS